MTHPQSKSRIDIADQLNTSVLESTFQQPPVAAARILAAITVARISLHFHGYSEDARWVGAHLDKTSSTDATAVSHLADRLIERLHIEHKDEPAPMVTRVLHDSIVTALVEENARLRAQLAIAAAHADGKAVQA
ncbi:hypothetical protein ATM97_27950 [Nocardia sp. MH4]|uniref:hypothetical protein n=1 Tax=Nocardia sp. MH4 TaxID=1768677 RepID=UPI001C4FEE39|nr:hypothetical protein [Nocardia sp. MH4]MBW0275039.1 hypothetical protein [Nocardia sp. MH4]